MACPYYIPVITLGMPRIHCNAGVATPVIPGVTTVTLNVMVTTVTLIDCRKAVIGTKLPVVTQAMECNAYGIY